jgi:hypothetical protein
MLAHEEFMRLVNRMGELAGATSSAAHMLQQAVAFAEVGHVPPKDAIDLWREVAREALAKLEAKP